MRILILGGLMLVVAVAVLRARRGTARVRPGGQPSPSATERWEDEGGAIRGRPA
jgi:hypothetical protein